MTQQMFLTILLSVIGFIGALMVQQLIKIADAVNGIQKDLQVLTNDHTNLKEDVKEVKHRVSHLENKI